jgi:DNA-binding response OmpR family regulator
MSIRILIVDDEPHIRTVMRMALEGPDYDIHEAGSGEDALDVRTASQRWDAILLDERMPGMSGLETLKALRERNPASVVIMVTAYASIDLAVEAMRLGATDFVQKPMSPETLRAAVAAAVSKARGEWVPPPAPADATTSHSYEVWVMNGFHVVDAGAGRSPTERRFNVIQGRDGSPRPVTVSFTTDVTAAASDYAERSLGEDSEFWMQQAGLALAQYVWNHAEAPADGRLVVESLTRDIRRDLDRARQG